MTLTRKISSDKTSTRGEPRLVVIEGPNKGTSLRVDGTVAIGSRKGSELCLEDATVSREHAEVTITAEGYLLQDLGSTNGTFLNGVRIDRAYLRDGAILTMGKCRLRFQLDEAGKLLSTGGTGQGFDQNFGQNFGEMVAVSESMQRAFTLLEGLAASDITVLVEGETGTGKELAARAVHDRSPRAKGPFVIFDCSTIPQDLMESELFGYVKGAFTGADISRPGAVEDAGGGTLFLDEIGELPLNLQPKLLRLLDRREYKRLGTSQHQEVDVRFVAATNRDLEALVREGTFRQDLFYRVSAARAVLPPLRERPEDIPVLIRTFLDRVAERRGSSITLKKAGQKKLQKHGWPGNVRELKNVLETAAALAQGDTIDAPDLTLRTGGHGGSAGSDSPGSLADAEALAVKDALARAGGNKRQAARLLGIAPSTLYAKMKKLGLD
jgi:two-component system nitrogen regulation response regulator GlnG